MNRAGKIAFLICLLVTLAQSVTAQNSTNQEVTTIPISLSVEVGYSFGLTSGGARRGINELIDGFESLNTENRDIKGKLKPKLSPLLGVNARYQYQENIHFNVGLRFIQRGYNLKIKGEDKHPEFQFDQEFLYREKYRISTFEIPLSASYQLKDEVTVSAGFILGFAMGSSSKVKLISIQDTIINGTLDPDLSSSDNSTLEIPDSANSPYLGFSVSAEYEILPDVSVAFTLLRTGSYSRHDYGKLADTSVMLSVNYALYQFK